MLATFTILAPLKTEFAGSVRTITPEVVEEEPIPQPVLEAISHVRRTRLIDMRDRETVMLLAANLGHGAAMEWLVYHRFEYPRILELTA